MKISLNWIKDYVDIEDVDMGWLVKKLTVTTAEIEGVQSADDDVIIEIDNKSLTNRPDLWCHYGIAREISAITGRPLREIDYAKEEELTNGKPELDISIEARDKCLRYSAIKIDNVRLERSPEFIAKRLLNCGIRPINIVVDIANYVMLDIGQPLHTFDKEGIGQIKVATLEENIRFKTLDDVERELSAGTLMINNEEKPLAVAGIIGGLESAVSENTRGIILESATFDGTAIRKAEQALGIRTDASARYEKFLDTSITIIAAGRFIRLLGRYQPQITLASPLYDQIIKEVKPVNISINHGYIETYLGNSIESTTVTNILESLQFGVEVKESKYDIRVPTFRASKDVTCKADIIEEILRVYGYDNIKGSPYKAEAVPVYRDSMKDIQYSIKDLLVKKFNFNEVHSYSWYDNNWLKRLQWEYENTLKIVNSSVKQFERLRSDMLPNLLKIIYDNRKNYEEISIFEIGRIFVRKGSELEQPRHLTTVIFSNRDEAGVCRRIKGICSYILKNTKNIEAGYDPVGDTDKEQCQSVTYNAERLGLIYSVPAAVLKLFGSRCTIKVLDIDLEMLDNISGKQIKYKEVSKYPDTYLDFSILTPIDMPYSELIRLVEGFAHPLLLQTEYIDTYCGENTPRNMKSTTMRMIIGDKSRTLQFEEISEVKEHFTAYINANGMVLR